MESRNVAQCALAMAYAGKAELVVALLCLRLPGPLRCAPSMSIQATCACECECVKATTAN